MVKYERESYKLKKELLSKREPELKDFENSQLIHIGKKMRKYVLEKNTMGVLA